MTASALDRRDLLRLLAGAGLVAAVPRRADADLPNATAPAPYAGPFLVTVHAGGGWDATHLCDPKPSAGPDDAEPINNFLPALPGVAAIVASAQVSVIARRAGGRAPAVCVGLRCADQAIVGRRRRAGADAIVLDPAASAGQ